MLMQSIEQLFVETQWVNGKPVLENGDVWCPMCDVWHENNTLCQRSG